MLIIIGVILDFRVLRILKKSLKTKSFEILDLNILVNNGPFVKD